MGLDSKVKCIYGNKPEGKDLNKGFTLIELAIVVVVLGILVIGVVGAQGLIKSAKNQKLMSDLKQLSMSTTIFKDTYGYLPGDFPDAEDYWPDDDVYISDSGSQKGNGNKTITWMESLAASKHLELAELVWGSYFLRDDTYDRISVVGLNVIESQAYNGIGYQIISWNGYIHPHGGGLYASENGVFWNVAKDQKDWHSIRHPAFTGEEAYLFDKKYDDAKPFRGKIFSYRGSGFTSGGNCYDHNNGSNGDYIIDDETTSCTLRYYHE